MEHVRERYAKVLGMTKEQQKKRTAENMNEINEIMRKKKDGHTLGEKIEKYLEKIKSKDAVSLVDDTFFTQCTEGGLNWYVRRADFLNYKARAKNVDDEEEKERIEQQRHEEREAARDQTFSEFIDRFEDHIEGRACNDRVARESNMGDDAKSQRSKSQRGKSRAKSDAEGEDEDEDAEADAKSAKSHKSTKSDKELLEEINRKFEEERMALPESCFVSFSKSTKIEKLESKYVLVAHPAPSFEGEMLIIQPKKDD